MSRTVALVLRLCVLAIAAGSMGCGLIAGLEDISLSPEDAATPDGSDTLEDAGAGDAFGAVDRDAQPEVDRDSAVPPGSMDGPPDGTIPEDASDDRSDGDTASIEDASDAERGARDATTDTTPPDEDAAPSDSGVDATLDSGGEATLDSGGDATFDSGGPDAPPDAAPPGDGSVSPAWVPMNQGFYGAHVVGMVMSPSTDSILYAGTTAGLFVTSNGGATWAPAAGALGTAPVTAIAAASPNVLFVATAKTSTTTGLEQFAALYRSVDGGNHWTTLTVTGNPGEMTSIAALNATTAYFVAGGETWATTDGATFAQMASNPLTSAALAIGPDGSVYDATGDFGLYKLSGTTWNEIYTYANGLVVHNVAVDPGDASTIYLLTDMGLYRSTNGGSAFTTIDSHSYVALAVDPTNSLNLYALASGQAEIYLATDGATFNEVAFDVHTSSIQPTTVLVDPLNPAHVFVGAGSQANDSSGVYESTLRGVAGSWAPANAGMVGNGVTGLVALGAGHIWANTLGISSTSNGGTSWAPLATAPGGVLSIAVGSGGTEYAAGQGVLNVSSNSGLSWTSTPAQYELALIALDPRSGDLYGAPEVAGGVVLKATDGGTSFTTIDVSGPGNARLQGVVVAASDSTRFLAFNAEMSSGNSGLFMTQDDATFLDILPGVACGALAVDPTTSSNVYCASGATVYRTTDATNSNGASWTPGTVAAGTTVNALLVDGTSPSTVYAATSNGVFKSTNAGAGWSPASNGLGSNAVQSLAFDPATTQTIYAGTVVGGVYKTVTGGM